MHTPDDLEGDFRQAIDLNATGETCRSRVEQREAAPGGHLHLGLSVGDEEMHIVVPLPCLPFAAVATLSPMPLLRLGLWRGVCPSCPQGRAH